MASAAATGRAVEAEEAAKATGRVEAVSATGQAAGEWARKDG